VSARARRPMRRARRRGGSWLRLGVIGAGLALAVGVRAAPVDELHRFLAQTSSASGDFTQWNSKPAAADRPAPAGPAVSQGSFEFLRPGRFRWSYRAPYEQLIVSDGEHLYMFDKDLNQVTKKKLTGALPASPASILFGSNDFERDFTIQNDGGADGIDWIRATPNGKDSLFSSIRIGFHEGLPVAMQLRDSFGQTTRLAFDHVQRNPALSIDRFRFTPPSGVDVLEDQ